MNPETSLSEAIKTVLDAEKVLAEMLEAQARAVTNQKQLIKVAKATAKAWQEIVDKAKELDRK